MGQADIKKRIEAIYPEYQAVLGKMVGIPSVNAPDAGKGAPFGKDVRTALETMLDVAKNMGFKTFIDPEGYYGYAEVGEGKEMLGVLGHLDVVPVGNLNEWKTNPFELTEIEGELYGRGTQDDKGPTLASMFALKLLIDSGAKLTKRVRFIYGADEETLWLGMKAYVKKEEHPTYGFTPDAEFPLIYAEKGLVEYTLINEEKSDIIFKGGSAFNAVPATATIAYDKELEEELKKLDYNYEVKDNQITVLGKAMHALDADKGINAINRLATALCNIGKENKLLKFIVEAAGDPHGTKIFGDVSDEMSGKLIFNLGLADFGADKQTIGVDIRFPVTLEKEKVDQLIEEAGKKYGVQVEQFDYLQSLYVDVKSELVQKLMQAYQEVSGDTKTQPISTGGATFARSMKNIVAFGALFPWGKDSEHQVNEHANIEQLKSAMEVYYRAFELLATEA